MSHAVPNPPNPLSDLPREKLPRHVAVIMDGNGRWAVRRGLPRFHGHRQGMEQVRDVVTEAANLHDALGGFDCLTLYSFSLENWKRPADEVEFLMGMYVEYLRRERPTMMRHNIRFRQIGRTDGLPAAVTDEVARTYEETGKNDGLTLCLALNYGGRAEIADAARAIAGAVGRGEIDPADVDESIVQRHLYTAGMPDVDLLVRTAGELRVSNYLLWQISYAEIHVTPDCWPDFTPAHLHAAVRDYAGRNRRFGALDHTNTLVASRNAEVGSRK